MSRATRVSVLLASALLAATAGAGRADELVGIDVSHHSGAIDWDAVLASGVDFVYVKASEGVDAADPRFEEHWTALGRAGVPRGAYHFYVTEDDPEAQARFYLSRVALAANDLPPAVDVELLGHGTEGPVAPQLRRFLELVEEATGRVPVIYTGAKFWDEHLGPGFERHPLWIAEYEVDAPTVPASWEGWHLWQFEGDADVPGVEKGADRSRLHPDLALDDLFRAPSGHAATGRP